MGGPSLRFLQGWVLLFVLVGGYPLVSFSLSSPSIATSRNSPPPRNSRSSIPQKPQKREGCPILAPFARVGPAFVFLLTPLLSCLRLTLVQPIRVGQVPLNQAMSGLN